jgi:hypothetical protein
MELKLWQIESHGHPWPQRRPGRQCSNSPKTKMVSQIKLLLGHADMYKFNQQNKKNTYDKNYTYGTVQHMHTHMQILFL